MSPQKCEKCPAMIYMAVSRSTGKPMPVDADPSPNGNVRLAFKTADRVIVADVLGREAAATARAAGDNLRMNHFVTCPEAAHFRKPKAGAR